MSSRHRKTNSRYEDEEFTLVQFLEDGIFHVLPSVDVTVEDNEKVAKYKDNKFYKCTVLKTSDDKESLLKQKNSLSIKPKKKEKKAAAARTKKTAKEDTCTQTGQNIKKRKGMENKEKKGKELKEKQKKDKDRQEKEKKRQMLSTRVENLVEKMTNESVDDRFSSGIIDQCCQILSIRAASCSEDSDIDEGQHQDASEDPETPLSVRQHPHSSPQALLSQSRNKQSTLVLPGTSYQRPRSLDTNPEAELHLMIQQQEARKRPETYVPVRQQPPAQRLQPNLPSADKSVQKQPTGRHQFSSIFGQPVNTSRPTTGMKRPRQQPLIQAIDESDNDEDFTCSKCKKLKQENEQLKRNLEEILQNKVSEPPRPGKVHPLSARRFQMVELIPGSRVFVYANIIEQSSRRASGTGCAACLLNAFYTNEELKGKNLTGANGKSAVDPDILNSIIGFTLKKYQGCTESAIKISLRNKLTTLNSRKGV